MDIAILGAGIAGLSTAIALLQKGFQVSVYERFSAPAHIGAGVVLWPNAVFVLQQLGVFEELAAVSGQPEYMQRLTQDGEMLGRIDIASISKQMGYPSLSILRKDLLAILLSRLKALGGQVQYGYKAVDIVSTADAKAHVYFEHGEVIKPELVIAADGRMKSQGRVFIQGNNVPNYQGFINWIGVYQADDNVFDDLSIRDYWGIGERFGIVPVSSGSAYWAAGIAQAEIGDNNPSQYLSELTSRFHSWPGLVRKMIKDSDIKTVKKIYVHDHDPVSIWHKHNLIMIGDAAHAALPTSGQGACQALEDAWHLVNCLEDNPADLSEVFRNFTRLRYDKTSGIIMTGRGLAESLFNDDERYCRDRNEAAKCIDYQSLSRAMSTGWGQGLPLG